MKDKNTIILLFQKLVLNNVETTPKTIQLKNFPFGDIFILK